MYFNKDQSIINWATGVAPLQRADVYLTAFRRVSPRCWLATATASTSSQHRRSLFTWSDESLQQFTGKWDQLIYMYIPLRQILSTSTTTIYFMQLGPCHKQHQIQLLGSWLFFTDRRCAKCSESDGSSILVRGLSCSDMYFQSTLFKRSRSILFQLCQTLCMSLWASSLPLNRLNWIEYICPSLHVLRELA